VQKTKIQFGFGFLKTEPSKNLTSFSRFSDRNCMQSPIQIKKWLKVTLLALNVQIKNVLKHDRNRV